MIEFGVGVLLVLIFIVMSALEHKQKMEHIAFEEKIAQMKAKFLEMQNKANNNP